MRSQKTPTLTVGEIAERIREPDEELGAVVDRLRNFTKVGLIKPLGTRNPGTGRKRLYPATALIDAALLSKFTLLFGIPASRVRLFGNALTLAREAALEFEHHQRNGRLIFLIVGVVRDRKPLGKTLSSMLQYVDDRDVIERGRPIGFEDSAWSHRGLAVPENLEFGLTVNLTAMFKSIGLGENNG